MGREPVPPRLSPDPPICAGREPARRSRRSCRASGKSRFEGLDDAQLIRELGDLEHTPHDVIGRAHDAQLDLARRPATGAR